MTGRVQATITDDTPKKTDTAMKELAMISCVRPKKSSFSVFL